MREIVGMREMFAEVAMDLGGMKHLSAQCCCIEDNIWGDYLIMHNLRNAVKQS